MIILPVPALPVTNRPFFFPNYCIAIQNTEIDTVAKPLPLLLKDFAYSLLFKRLFSQDIFIKL
jgi:hypothetical protein